MYMTFVQHISSELMALFYNTHWSTESHSVFFCIDIIHFSHNVCYYIMMHFSRLCVLDTTFNDVFCLRVLRHISNTMESAP